jgi:hypothetical protein
MKNSTIRKTGFWFLGSLLLCSFILSAHIYSATHKEIKVVPQLQLSRIDFQKKPDSLQSREILSFVRSLGGVKSTYFNQKDGILVYTFLQGEQTSENVFRLVMASGNYKAKRYMVDPATAKTGCPVIGKPDSFQGKLVRLISSL